jgi:hypothetical protein
MVMNAVEVLTKLGFAEVKGVDKQMVEIYQQKLKN